MSFFVDLLLQLIYRQVYIVQRVSHFMSKRSYQAARSCELFNLQRYLFCFFQLGDVVNNAMEIAIAVIVCIFL